MPCYEPRREEPRVEYRNGENPQPYKDKISYLEGALCAIITELEERGIAGEIIPKAIRRGLIDIMKLWEKHTEEDVARISQKLHRFSEHEQEVMKKILNKEI